MNKLVPYFRRRWYIVGLIKLVVFDQKGYTTFRFFVNGESRGVE